MKNPRMGKLTISITFKGFGNKMDEFKELGIVGLRIFTILPFMIFVTLYMGKRSIGELPVFDFLVVLVFGSVVGADIADPNIQHIHTIVAMILIAILQKIVTKVKISSRKVGKWLSFEPTVVIENGRILIEDLKKIGYTIDNILMLLREKEVFSIEDVQIGIIESNGTLSISKNPLKQPLTAEDAGVMKTSASLAFPLIVDGILHERVLETLNVDKKWVMAEIHKEGVHHIQEVFYATINTRKEIQVVKTSTTHRYPYFYN
ncbi:DUF421 domain-containing protein [Rossellomorea aquimaris]|uniref:DUF421 domain-containing protein n=1 Tax=Rossellomorea aquimaris TaxID=189382 RepID=UPI000B056D5B|nr:DUF421 domain-containing protein [Rossellomorea aquimaris]